MRLLGAILAGGRSRRFGSDKAAALLDGRALIDHVGDALERQCDAVVVCGRASARWTALDDRPRAGLGPLGGLCAALVHGRDARFDAVLAAPCDAPGLPDRLVEQLGGGGAGPAYVAALPVIGLWPTALAAALERFVDAGDDRSLRAWATAAGAVAVDFPPLPNINTRADLAAFRDRRC